MRVCETIYLDNNGNRSNIYYGNVDNLGHDKAFELYLKDMAGKPSTIEREIIPFRSFSQVNDLPKNSKLKGIRSLFNDNQKKYLVSKESDGIAKEVVYRMKAKELIQADNRKYGYSNSDANAILIDNKVIPNDSLREGFDLALQDAEDFFNQHEKEFKKAVDTIKSNWEIQTDTGIYLDKYITKHSIKIKKRFFIKFKNLNKLLLFIMFNTNNI